jgi:hypothetical protein
MRSWSLLLVWAVAFSAALPAQSEVRRVQATGQAVETGLGADVTRRRALQEALIEAALTAGVDVNGFAASANSILTADQLVVRPSSRILGYTILSEGKSDSYYRVKVEAFVGEPIATDLCAKRPAITATSYQPDVSVDLGSPVWLEAFGDDLADDVQDALARSRNAKLTQSSAKGPAVGAVSTVAQDMDYATLTQRRKTVAAPSPAVGLSITSEISLSMVGGDHAGQSVIMVLTVRLIEAASLQVKSQTRIERRASMGTALPIRAINQMLRKDRRALAAKLLEGVAAELDVLFGAHRCEPLDATLEIVGGKLSVPLGAQNGLTKNMLAYTDRGDQAYLLFRITDLQANRAVLATIDPMTDPKQLQGVPVRFMEGVP